MKYKYIVFFENENQRHEFRFESLNDAWVCYLIYRELWTSGGIVDMSTAEIFEYYGLDEDE